MFARTSNLATYAVTFRNNLIRSLYEVNAWSFGHLIYLSTVRIAQRAEQMRPRILITGGGALAALNNY